MRVKSVEVQGHTASNVRNVEPLPVSAWGVGARYAALLVAGYAVWLAGCGIIVIKNPAAGDESEWSKARPERFEGPECAKVLFSLEESRNQSPIPEVDPSPETQVLLATCARNEKGPANLRDTQDLKKKELEFSELYESFNDHAPDPIRVTLAGYQARYVQDRTLVERGIDKGDRQAAVDALASLMLSTIDEALLTERLASVQVPDAAKQAFIALFRSAKADLSLVVSKIEGPDKELLVSMPEQVLARRKGQFKAQAASWQTLDGYAERLKQAQATEGGDPKLRADLEALRPGIVEVAKDGYLADPLFARVTREIALQFALAQDGLGHATERAIYARQPFPETLAQEISYAQLGMISEFRAARERFRKAKDAGLDDAAAKARAGRGYSEFEPNKLYTVDAEMPTYEKLLDERAEAFPFLEVVENMTPKDGAVEVTFKKTPVETWESYGCYQTGRISRITGDGRIEYEEHCNQRKKMVMHENVRPLSFSAEDAKLFKRGSKVRGMSQGGRGQVLWLVENEQIVSERGYKVPPRPLHPKQQE